MILFPILPEVSYKTRSTYPHQNQYRFSKVLVRTQMLENRYLIYTEYALKKVLYEEPNCITEWRKGQNIGALLTKWNFSSSISVLYAI